MVEEKPKNDETARDAENPREDVFHNCLRGTKMQLTRLFAKYYKTAAAACARRLQSWPEPSVTTIPFPKPAMLWDASRSS